MKLQRLLHLLVVLARAATVLASAAGLTAVAAGCAEPPDSLGPPDTLAGDAGGGETQGQDAASADASDAPLVVNQLGWGHLDLGDTALEPGSGFSPWLRFSVPPGARSVTVTALAPGVGLAVGQWQDGAGVLQVVPSWLGGPLAPWLCLAGCVQRQAARPSQQSAWLVAAKGQELPAGQWQLRFYGFDPVKEKPAAAAAKVRVDAVFGADAGQRSLRVNFCLTGALGITAALAKDHPRIQTAIAQLQEIYAAAGIDVQVALVDVAAPNLLVEHDAADAEVSELFRAGAKLPLAVNIFLVEQLYRSQPSGTQPIAGLAGGIPGPPLQVGTDGAGVAVSLALGPGEDDRLGTVIAHELGHFLGLYHTVEAAAAGAEALQDQLADTDGDPKWLMHWSPGPGSAALSPEQMRILRASPWLQGGP